MGSQSASVIRIRIRNPHPQSAIRIRIRNPHPQSASVIRIRNPQSALRNPLPVKSTMPQESTALNMLVNV
jgi:hypothetical protein